MKHGFIHKLKIQNLLYLQEQIRLALLDKDPNDVLDYIKKLETQQRHVKNNKDYDVIERDLKILERLTGLNTS